MSCNASNLTDFYIMGVHETLVVGAIHKFQPKKLVPYNSIEEK